MRECDMLKRSIMFILLALAVASPPAMALDVGDKAPDFTLKTPGDQENVTLSKWRGKKAVMLVFWATWCPNCQAEIPAIKEIDGAFNDTIKVVAVNVDVNDSPSKAIAYKAKNSINYTMAYDHGTKISHSYGVNGTPTVFIIDKAGTVRYKDAVVPKAAEIGKNMAK
jgi:peroxiredoxin